MCDLALLSVESEEAEKISLIVLDVFASVKSRNVHF